MKIIADTHVHTIASGHAHSTVNEIIQVARAKDLKFVAITDHTSAMEGAPRHEYFRSLTNILPRIYNEVGLVRGCEANVLDAAGALDLPDDILSSLDLVIASMHTLVFKPMDRRAHTQAWLAIAENPNVDIIGHCGDGRFDFDHEPVIKAFAKHGKVVEINAHSPKARPNSEENCRAIAQLCIRYNVPVVCSSDAHFAPNVGVTERSVHMLEEIGYPEELVLNADANRFASFLESRVKGNGSV